MKLEELSAPLPFGPVGAIDLGMVRVVPLCHENHVETYTKEHTLTLSEDEYRTWCQGWPQDILYPRIGHFTDFEVISAPESQEPTVEVSSTLLDTYYVITGHRDRTRYETLAEVQQTASDLMCEDPGILSLSVADSATRVTLTRPLADENTITVRLTRQRPKDGARINEYAVQFWVHA